MKIGIIGAGNIGVGLGERLAAKGHDTVVSFSHTFDGASLVGSIAVLTLNDRTGEMLS